MAACKVVMFVDSSSKPTTGGGRYWVALHRYLGQKDGITVVPVDLSELPTFIKRSPLLVELALTNFWLLLRLVRGQSDNIILFEDFHWHPRLFLFNPIMKAFKNPIAGSEPTESVLS